MKCKVFTNTAVIIIDDEYCDVALYDEHKRLKKGVAYINGDLVYIYRGKATSKKPNMKPGIYKINGEYVFVEPSEKNREKYSIDNINELNLNSIFDEIEEHHDDFVSMEDLETISNNADMFKPIIKEDDDFLKYVIKQAIIEKNINLKNYKGQFQNEYSLNNMKSALSKPTKMTVPNFLRWMEILSLDFELTLKDSGKDKVNPLPKPVTIKSKDIF